MCDTLVALAGETAAGKTLFAKNSDREANEAQAVEFHPRASHPEGARLRATYIEIPQARQTHAVILCRPYWMWGAEMGVNEHGVVIGNEAVVARLKPSMEPRLLGMDLLRLGLERGATAREALAVITGLLEAHGQGGSGGHTARFYYDNSFLIADAKEAFVLETVGRDWAAEKVTAIRAISNAYSIGSRIEQQSAGLERAARDHGLIADGESFHMANAFGFRRSAFASGEARLSRASSLLARHAPRLTPAHMMAFLRDHGRAAAHNPRWRPDGLLGGAVCAHASWGPVRRFGQTTGSLVAELSAEGTRLWLTATSAPCTSLFKPVIFAPGMTAGDLPDFGPAPRGTFDPAARWWRHERLHRALLWDYPAALPAFAPERARLERAFCAVTGPDAAKAAWARADAAEDDWTGRVLAASLDRRAPRPSFPYVRHWSRLNRLAKLP